MDVSVYLFFLGFFVPLFGIMFSIVIDDDDKIKNKIKQWKINCIEKKLDNYINKKYKNIINFAQNLEPILKRYVKENDFKIDVIKKISKKNFLSCENFFYNINNIFKDENKNFNEIVFKLIGDDMTLILNDILPFVGGGKYNVVSRVCELHHLNIKDNNTLTSCMKKVIKKTPIKYYKRYEFVEQLYSLVTYCGYYYNPLYGLKVSDLRTNYNIILTYIFYKYCTYINVDKPMFDELNLKIIKQ